MCRWWQRLQLQFSTVVRSGRGNFQLSPLSTFASGGGGGEPSWFMFSARIGEGEIESADQDPIYWKCLLKSIQSGSIVALRGNFQLSPLSIFAGEEEESPVDCYFERSWRDWDWPLDLADQDRIDWKYSGPFGPRNETVWPIRIWWIFYWLF